MPNIRNNKSDPILDNSIDEEYLYTTIKILEVQRFNNIDVVLFKNWFNIN